MPLKASSGNLNVFFLFQTYNLRNNLSVFFCDFFWEGGCALPKKIVINLPGNYEKLPEAKENPIGSAVSEILWYK